MQIDKLVSKTIILHLLYDEKFRELGERVLIVKSVNGKSLKILVEPSYTILKLNIEYAYGRNIYPLEQQKLW